MLLTSSDKWPPSWKMAAIFKLHAPMAMSSQSFMIPQIKQLILDRRTNFETHMSGTALLVIQQFKLEPKYHYQILKVCLFQFRK